MKNLIPLIAIDIDNTIIDTSIRKYSIIKKINPNIEISIDDIRDDFYLKDNSLKDIKDEIFKILNSNIGIEQNLATSFVNCTNVINNWIKEGIKVVLITARDLSQRKATQKELKLNGINLNNELTIHFYPNKEYDKNDILSYKKSLLESYKKSNNILCFIGDTDTDISAGINASVHTIQFESSNIQIEKENPLGVYKCRNWYEVNRVVEVIKNKTIELSRMRDVFSLQYASWLTDMDEKAKNNVVIGLGLSTIAGALISKESNLNIEKFFLIFSIFLSILSVIFSLLSITPRRTSGKNVGSRITNSVKGTLRSIRYLFYLLFGFKSCKYMGDDDPVKYFESIKNMSISEQRVLHYDFILDKLFSTDPEAMKNVRLFSLRSAHYSKIYPNKISSSLTIFSILFLLGWTIIQSIK